MVCPEVVGEPVPTVANRVEPVFADRYNWPPKMPGTRKFVGLVAREVDAVDPKTVERIPPAELVPEIQRLDPSVLAAPRGFPPLMASVRAVVVSTVPPEFTRPITLLTVVEVEVVMLAVPVSAS